MHVHQLPSSVCASVHDTSVPDSSASYDAFKSNSSRPQCVLVSRWTLSTHECTCVQFATLLEQRFFPSPQVCSDRMEEVFMTERAVGEGWPMVSWFLSWVWPFHYCHLPVVLTGVAMVTAVHVAMATVVVHFYGNQLTYLYSCMCWKIGRR